MSIRNKNLGGNNKVYEEIPYKFSARKKCRICLEEGKIPIFGEEDLSVNVMDFGSITIHYGDNLPQYLCNACHSLLGAAILFRKTAQKSNEILQNANNLDEDVSIKSEDYPMEQLYDTDDETTIKREYLEYKDTSDSEDDFKLKFDSESDKGSEMSFMQSVAASIKDDKEYEMLKIKVENDGNENNEDLVMIIVSDKDKQGTFKCLKCNITFNHRSELEQHDTDNHPNISPDHKRCEICYESVLKSNYKVHLKEHRQKYKEKFDKKYGKVECDICLKKINKSYLKYHKKMHGSAEEQAERSIQCPICNKSYSAQYFNDHLKRVHDEPKSKRKSHSREEKRGSPKTKSFHKCPICDKNIVENKYKEHLVRHGGSRRRYICDQCGKVFKHSSAFKTHTLTHGSELKYKCQFCPYRGLHQGLLKIHVRTHTGDYNYKCTECPARFITKSNLSKHLHTHSRICKFKCDTCGKGFYSKRDVDKHIKTVHLELRSCICNICGKGFGHRDNMVSHQLKAHKREKITDRKGRMPSYLKAELQLNSKLL